MKQIWIPKTGKPEVLEVRDAEAPKLAADEVRVEVAAAGVNFADLMARMGLYPDAPPLPAVMGYEISGTVTEVGADTVDVAVGDLVLALCRFGGYSSEVVLHHEQITKLPPGKDLIEAASIPVTYLTSWMMIEVMGRVRAGDRVLVHSAGGGVGLAALDLLKRRDAFAVGLASVGKHEFLRERGYNQLLDSRDDAWAKKLQDEPGFDLILDPVGGKSWADGLNLLRAGGRLVCFGMSANAQSTSRDMIGLVKNLVAVPWLKINPITLMNENKGVMGVNMGHLWDERDRVSVWMKEIVALWAEDKIRPYVHATVPFDEAARAHEILHNRENRGKVLLVP